jgi:superkiller protein 3
VKAQIATEVEQLVHGAVLLGLPDELAWTIFIEGKNSDSIGEFLPLPLTLHIVGSSSKLPYRRI